MPFGLSYAGATFQQVIESVIGNELDPLAFANLDDIIIVWSSFEDHKKHLTEVLYRLTKASRTISKEESVFCQQCKA